MRVAYEDRFAELEPLLAQVEKPARYIDHEWGAARKSDAAYRACLIYPDTYEVGLPTRVSPSSTTSSTARRASPASAPTCPGSTLR